jgi:hypothetical protein
MIREEMNKEKLDQIIEKYQAQPVGHGYIDIIVSRKNYKNFVSELVNNDYTIKSVSWWEWCPGKKENEYGLGGPLSQFYDGWFSELPIDLDCFPLPIEIKKEELVNEIINKIETKVISFHDETVTFKSNDWLTPALWLEVPDDWRNKGLQPANW